MSRNRSLGLREYASEAEGGEHIENIGQIGIGYGSAMQDTRWAWKERQDTSDKRDGEEKGNKASAPSATYCDLRMVEHLCSYRNFSAWRL